MSSKLIEQKSPLDQLHTIAIKKKDVAIVASALAFFYTNREAAKIKTEAVENLRELFEFFKRVYESKGAE
jgi:hypothetical protein